MSGDISAWLSTPDEEPLRPIKYLTAEHIASINVSSPADCDSPRSKRSQPQMMALATESMNAIGTSDTPIQAVADQREKNNKSSRLNKLSSAFNFNDSEVHTSHESMGTVSSVLSSKRSRRKRKSLNLSVEFRKCVSCPEAAHVDVIESKWSSAYSETFSYNDRRFAQSLTETSLENNAQEPLDTTTLASIDIYPYIRVRTDLTSSIATTTYDDNAVRSLSPTSTLGSESTMDICSEDDSIDFRDDCSRGSFVSLYRVPPIENLATEATAASLEVMAGPVALTYVNNVVPAVSPGPSRAPSRVHTLCRMCRMDGLKFHPACPDYRPGQKVSPWGTLTQGVTSELRVIEV